MIALKKHISILLFLYCYSYSIAQSDLSFRFIQHNGNLIAITKNFPESGLSTVSEFNFNFHTLGSKYWQNSYALPKIGISIAFQQYGNWDILGGGISIQPNIAFQKHFGKSWVLESRTGLGVAFFNSPFNAISNPTNTVIGSFITASFSEYIGINKSFGKLSTHIGASVWHWSNGHTSTPNVGGNFMGYSFGVQYLIRKTPTSTPIKFALDSLDKKIHLDVAAAIGIHEIEGTFEPTDGPKYPVYGLTIGATKRVGTVEKLTLGVDFNYFTDYHEQLINQEIITQNYRLNASNLVGFIGNEFLFGRLSFYIQMGVNIYAPFREIIAETIEFNSATAKNLFIYSTNKLGFRYYWFSDGTTISEKIYSEITLKTIFGKADFVQFKLGYNL